MYSYLLGWVLKELDSSCTHCSLAIAVQPEQDLVGESQLTVMKGYRDNALRHPSLLTYNTIKRAEIIYQHYAPVVSQIRCPKTFILGKILSELENTF